MVFSNYGNATGKEIEALANEISDSVFRTSGVRLEKEVNLI
ncbi:MAG: hypothetical protein U5L96_05225 [Owenweeksia sp.]|nr:hypothetical protein [Owenweeksia sp.]